MQEISIGPLIRLYARYGLDLNELLSGDPIEPSTEHNLDVVAWTLEVRKLVQGITGDRGIRPKYIDEILGSYARLRSPAKPVSKSDLTAFVDAWIEGPTSCEIKEQLALSRKTITKKVRKRRSVVGSFKLPGISANKETASYPRKRRTRPKGSLKG